MATQTMVVNEKTPGKSWLVFWEVKPIIDGENATFTCGEMVYNVELQLGRSDLKGWILLLVLKTTKDDKKSGSMVSVFHKGIRKEDLLKNELLLWWPLGTALDKSIGLVLQKQYPDSSCNFQILIEIPEDDYETKGLQAIQNNLSKLMENESLADIQFVFKDDQVPAHSAIIGASSPVFAAMFEGGRFKEGQTGTVNIEDIDSRVFRKLLQFLYTGSSGCSKNDPSDVLQALFLAADKYQVDVLKEVCEELLIRQLAIDHVLHLLVWAHLYGAGKLKEAAVAHIVKEQQQVWKLKEWEELSKNYTDLFFQICNRMFHHKNDSATIDDD